MVFPLTVVLAAAIVDPQQAPCELPCRIWLVNLGAVAAPGLGLGVRAAAGDGVFARSLGGTLIGFGAGTYLLGAPIVYWSRDLHERAFASLGLRLALPALGAVAGFAAGASGKSGDAASIGAIDGGLIGVSIGAAAAMILDAAWLARRDLPAVSEPPAISTAPAAERTGIPGGHVYVGIEGGVSLTGPLPSDWSGGGAGGTVAIHAQLEGEHALAAITLLDGRAGQTCKTIPFEPPYPRCQAEGVVALDLQARLRLRRAHLGAVRRARTVVPDAHPQRLGRFQRGLRCRRRGGPALLPLAALGTSGGRGHNARALVRFGLRLSGVHARHCRPSAHVVSAARAVAAATGAPPSSSASAACPRSRSA